MVLHGHKLLLKYLKNIPLIELKNKNIIEIGTVRENIVGQNSTEEFILFCKENEMFFYTVDMDPKNTENAIELAKKNNFENIYPITMKGEDFLLNFEKNIDYLYLDAFDFYHNNHSNYRKERYNNILNCDITNENCHKMHLDCVINSLKKFTNESLICFDDILDKKTFEGKGFTAVPYLLDNNFEIIEYIPNALIMKKII